MEVRLLLCSLVALCEVGFGEAVLGSAEGYKFANFRGDVLAGTHGGRATIEFSDAGVFRTRPYGLGGNDRVFAFERIGVKLVPAAAGRTMAPSADAIRMERIIWEEPYARGSGYYCSVCPTL